MFKFFKSLSYGAFALSCAFYSCNIKSVQQNAQSFLSCSKKDAVLKSAFTEQELDDMNVSITLVFKAQSSIPSDGVLNAFLPLDRHSGPFGRRFVASARRIKDALKLKGFNHCVTSTGIPFYAASGTPSLPPAWAQDVRVVLGLNTHPVAKPRYIQSVPSLNGLTSNIANPALLPAGWPPFGFFPTQLAEIYGFPRGGLGAGQTIGLVELTIEPYPGTAGFYPQDIKHYFEMVGIVPVPTVEAVSVDGAQNTPSDPNSADPEVCGDIECAGSVAPRAKILVFFAFNTAEGFYNCFAKMLHKPYNIPVISCSWGKPKLKIYYQHLLVIFQKV